jgi:uncharacterized RDD family membrane protein YckC
MTMMSDQHRQLTRLGHYAGFATRLIAWGVDRLIVAAIVAVVTVGADLVQGALGIAETLGLEEQLALIMTGLVVLLGLLIPIVYDIGFWLLAGQTPAKRMMGLRVVRTDGHRLTIGNCVRRYIGYWVSGFLFLGYLWILVDDRRQGFHDKIAGTFVVYAWPDTGPRVRPARDRLRSA